MIASVWRVSTLAPQPEQGAFDHRSLLYADDAEFLAGTAQFLRDGLEDGDLMLVAVGPEKTALLRDELREAADGMRFADMHELGRNPGRMISAWRDLVDARDGRHVRGIGEPIWAGRSPDELGEAQRHERLLNLAFAETAGFDLLCPYDVTLLSDAVIDEAAHSHPHARAAGSAWESGWNPFDGRLSPVPPGSTETWFRTDSLSEVRALVALVAADGGLAEARCAELVLAVGELATNSIRHGGGSGLLRPWGAGDRIVCPVEDAGHMRDPLVGRRRPRPGQIGGYGLWLVHQLCDLVQVRSAPFGSLVRVSMTTA